jgi:hypothetical protein
METLMGTTKEKQIIVEQVVVTGYVKHANGRKTPFSFDKKTLEPKDLEVNTSDRLYDDFIRLFFLHTHR